MTDQIPTLHDTELERATIAAVMLDTNAAESIALKPEDFYIVRNQTIYKGIQALVKRDGAADYLMLVNYLRERGELDEIGGPAYITEMLTVEYSNLHLERYADKLKDLSRRRSLMKTANETAKLACDMGIDIDKHIPGIIEDIVSTSSTKIKVYHISEVLSDLYDRIRERYAKYCEAKEQGLPYDEIWGIRTGFADFDQITGGVCGSDNILITGESGIGKTKFLGQAVHRMAAQEPGIFFSIEMDRVQIEQRELSHTSRVQSRKMKTGIMNDADLLEITTAIGRLEQLKLYISDPSDLSTTQLRAILMQYKQKLGIKWFALDYLYLLSDGQGSLDENNRTLTISAALKRTCKSIGIPGLIIHSLNKAGEMRGSGQVKYDCDIQLDITSYQEIGGYPVYNNQANVVTCSFKKGREIDGAHAFYLYKDDGYPSFRNYDWKGGRK